MAPPHSRRTSMRPRYRVIGGKPSVELKLRTPRQLFDERDPAPFRDRDLDDDAARYIHASFRELDDHKNARLSLYFESMGELAESPQEIVRAIHAFFRFEAETKRRELKDTFRHGFISLAIGLTFLFVCTAIAQATKGYEGNLLVSMLHEGSFILWWVSMWKPISTFLYDWWPIKESMKTYDLLANIQIDIHPLRAELLDTERRSSAADSPARIRTSTGDLSRVN
ncbi:MAG: hypothetical protein V4692_05720 [Bdellovibrionota bacterium]